MEKLKIGELGYVEEMRQRLGLDKNDVSNDQKLENMEPMSRVWLIAGWFLGSGSWADTFKEYFESQGLFLTTNPDADGVIFDWEV